MTKIDLGDDLCLEIKGNFSLITGNKKVLKTINSIIFYKNLYYLKISNLHKSFLQKNFKRNEF